MKSEAPWSWTASVWASWSSLSWRRHCASSAGEPVHSKASRPGQESLRQDILASRACNRQRARSSAK
eukprot:4430262-Alexandrium_andersonii.AAC.1